MKITKNVIRLAVAVCSTALAIAGMVTNHIEVTLVAVGILGGFVGAEANNRRED